MSIVIPKDGLPSREALRQCEEDDTVYSNYFSIGD